MRWAKPISIAIWVLSCVPCAAAVDPFAAARPGRTAVTASVRAELPANSPQLSVARPYAVFTPETPAPLSLKNAAPPGAALDWYQFWSVDIAFRNPRTSRADWAASVRKDVDSIKRKQGIRGSVIAVGALEALLAASGAADYNGVTIRPRVTGDAAVNRYGAGFMLRLAADIGDRIPLPTLNLTSLAAGDAPWAVAWLDEAVRNGIAGLTVIPPSDATAARVVADTLASLRGPNVYLPPPPEVAVIVPLEALERRPGGWDAMFRLYSGLRACGVWLNFVSDEAIATKSVSLARYRVVVVPSELPRSGAFYQVAMDAARRGATVVVLGVKKAQGTGARVLATDHDGRPAITERATGDGRVLYAAIAPFSPDGAWRGFWQGILRDSGVPDRPWLEAVTAE
jgi:hypothetical protein